MIGKHFGKKKYSAKWNYMQIIADISKLSAHCGQGRRRLKQNCLVNSDNSDVTKVLK